jgi:hypothetical protein
VNGTDVTYGKALKIWWSYAWRTFVLLVPVMVISMIIMFSIMPFPKPGQPAAMLRPDQDPGLMGKMSGLWILMMTLNILAQVQAMRWMLKTKWSDFRLQAVSDD